MLTVRAFRTEPNYDYFTVKHANGRPDLRQSGTWYDSLDGYVVEAGSELHFQSDASVTLEGFLVCAGAW